MDVEEFKKKYEELKDNPMYQNFCSILDTKNKVLEKLARENQKLKILVESSKLGVILNQKQEELLDKILFSKEVE